MNEEKINNELSELWLWFEYYDNQVKQYQRCLRMGVEFDGDIEKLDKQAIVNQARMSELRALVPHQEIKI